MPVLWFELDLATKLPQTEAIGVTTNGSLLKTKVGEYEGKLRRTDSGKARDSQQVPLQYCEGESASDAQAATQR